MRSGAYPQAGSAAGMGALIFTGPYRIPKLSFSTQSAFTNTCSRAPYRGPWQIETYLREQAVDRLARTMGIDPLELRRRNVIQRDQLPHLLPVGLPLDHVSPAETLEQAAAMIGYDEFRRHQQEQFQRDGCSGSASGSTSSRRPRWGPTAPSRPTSGSSRAAVSTCTSGRARTDKASRPPPRNSSPSTSVSLSTRSTVHQGDTSETPYAFGTGGSRSGPILGAAIQLAAQELRTKIAVIAAHQLEASEADIEIVDGSIGVRGTPARDHRR